MKDSLANGSRPTGSRRCAVRNGEAPVEQWQDRLPGQPLIGEA